MACLDLDDRRAHSVRHPSFKFVRYRAVPACHHIPRRIDFPCDLRDRFVKSLCCDRLFARNKHAGQALRNVGGEVWVVGRDDRSGMREAPAAFQELG